MKMNFYSVNPWTGEILAAFPAHSAKEAGRKLDKALVSWQQWKQLPVDQRLALLAQLKVLLQRNRDELAFSMSEEMGKTFSEARAEVDKSVLLIDFLQAKVPEWMEEKPLQEKGRKANVLLEPLGGILLVMPWNFPLWQVCRAALPALCAGNVVMLKHAPNVIRFSEKLETLFLEAGFPNGVFQGFRVEVADLVQLVSHTAVAAISFTGSEAAGRSMAALAGKYLKKCVLELGGSDPFIVLDDADVPAAAELAAVSRMLNNGQSCISAKRFLVHDSVIERFSWLLIQKISEYRPGNPCLPGTRLGPLARPDLVSNLQRQQKESIQAGAKVLFSMQDPVPARASVFQPVVLTDVQPGMPAFDEETFGPLVAITGFRSMGEAVSLANNSRYGLGASVHSADAEKAQMLARQLACGTVALNRLMRSDPALPFGGIKASGYGKELAREGFEEFCSKKVLLMD
jgi:succinate-semialdehyde dehydrogenase/glutarate-semialdehyde dehydrogenase